MGIFGWNYPPGAENDSNAPYNEEDIRMVSDCCGYPVYENTDICTCCLEHCNIIEEGE